MKFPTALRYKVTKLTHISIKLRWPCFSVITLIYFCLLSTPVRGEISELTWQYDQINPAVAYNSIDKEFLFVYEDHHWGWGKDGDIFGYLVKEGEQVIGTKLDIAYEGAQKRKYPTIIFNKYKREYLVVWVEEPLQYPGLGGVKARRLNANGQPVGKEIWLTSDRAFQANPKVAFNDKGNEYLVVWEEWGIETSSYIAGLRLNSELSPLDASPQSFCEPCSSPDVAYGADHYLLVYSDYSMSPDINIYGIWIPVSGSLSKNSFPIESWEHIQDNPAVVYNSGLGEFLVVWQDSHWGWGNDSDIYGRRLDPYRGYIGERIGIAYESDLDERRYKPKVAYNMTSGEYDIVYEIDYVKKNKRTVQTIAGRSMAADGKYLGDELLNISESTDINTRTPAIPTMIQKNTLIVYTKTKKPTYVNSSVEQDSDIGIHYGVDFFDLSRSDIAPIGGVSSPPRSGGSKSPSAGHAAYEPKPGFFINQDALWGTLSKDQWSFRPDRNTEGSYRIYQLLQNGTVVDRLALDANASVRWMFFQDGSYLAVREAKQDTAGFVQFRLFVYDLRKTVKRFYVGVYSGQPLSPDLKLYPSQDGQAFLVFIAERKGTEPPWFHTLQVIRTDNGNLLCSAGQIDPNVSSAFQTTPSVQPTAEITNDHHVRILAYPPGINGTVEYAKCSLDG